MSRREARLPASIKIRVPLHGSGADRLRAGLDAASRTGPEIGYRSGGVTSPDGEEITLWLSLDPTQLLDAYPALRQQRDEELRERLEKLGLSSGPWLHFENEVPSIFEEDPDA